MSNPVQNGTAAPNASGGHLAPSPMPAAAAIDWAAATETLAAIQRKWGCNTRACDDMRDTARCACAREWQEAIYGKRA